MSYALTLQELLGQPILNADTYKATHWTFEHPEFEDSYGYIEARVGGEFSYVQFLGLQYVLRTYLKQRVTVEMVDEAERELTLHGVPFDRESWMRVINKHNGFIPVRIWALPEGVVVDQGTVLVTIESTDMTLPGMAAYVETLLLRSVWYPTTIATRSLRWWKILDKAYRETGDVPADFALVDFGARGAHSTEAAALGGMAHLVNFQVTDNLLGVRFAKKVYDGNDPDYMPGFSIPATEHSVTTSWGKDNEKAFFENILAVHGNRPGIGGVGRYPVSVVIDTYDQDNAIRTWLTPEREGGLLERLKESNMRVVLRPDSGDPVTNVIHCLDLITSLVGATQNDKGYWVLPDFVRLIQGDGINEETLAKIVDAVRGEGWSLDNLVFGSGGGLLVHKAERDTHRFAMKTSQVTIGGLISDVAKQPKTDLSKASKAGRFAVIYDHDTGKLKTVKESEAKPGMDWLKLVYDRGIVCGTQSWEEVRAQSRKFREAFGGK